ncbi:pyridoxal phosphate-dependent decarboxylase family protein [Paenibacillus taichungensis]|uniref:pyridoxal phosphate-dependent decarboxylase family protein n=1 Tax=Paenibacillus taichungensis TaxID=484184 RepID=UPI0038D01469
MGQLRWDKEEAKILLEQAREYSFLYLDQLEEKDAFPNSEAIQTLKCFYEEFPETYNDPSEILRDLHLYGSPATVSSQTGKYYGYVNGGTLAIGIAARWLSDVWDQNAAIYEMSPIAAVLEEVCEKWLTQLLGLPSGTAAGFVSGSSIATLCGLSAGRNQLLKRMNWDIAEKGMFGAPKVRVIVGGEAHGSVFKALRILGFGNKDIEIAPTDDQGRIIPSSLPTLSKNCLIVIQAGNVNTGAFDPIHEICQLAASEGAWVHVDGAFGLWAAASEEKKQLTSGIELADSLTLDAHKTLNAPYDSGIIICKDRKAILNAMQSTGSYLLDSQQRDGMHYTPEMSRRARAVELWAVLKHLGRKGVEDLIEQQCRLAIIVAEGLQSVGFQILNEVVFNQVLVKCNTPENTSLALRYIQQSGECWCSGSRWKGEPVIRISLCSFTVTSTAVERLVQIFDKAYQLAKIQQ